MIDWGIIARIWAGYGVTVIVLTILLLVAWLAGLVVQRWPVRAKGNSKKG